MTATAEGSWTPQKSIIFYIFPASFLNIWPLAGPNIAEREASTLGKAKLSSRDQVGWRTTETAGLPWDSWRHDGSAGGRRKRLGSPGIPGGCASSRLDHGLKVELFFFCFLVMNWLRFWECCKGCLCKSIGLLPIPKKCWLQLLSKTTTAKPENHTF